MKNILVLGGTGAMGKPLVEILLSKRPDYNITVTSRSERKSIYKNLRYIVGNARDKTFIQQLVEGIRYDVIVDFMNYDLDEFNNRLGLLLESTDHYIWFSSSRVYANSEERLTEQSPRLLETSEDIEFLATNRYALRKARQENLLKITGKRNYTIIRPYITYNTDRLQLGILEKEQWLYRLLNGKSIVISDKMLDKETTLTYGFDVSNVIADVIIKNTPRGEIYQIAGSETIKWKDVLCLYCKILQEDAGINSVIYSSDSIKAIEMLWEGGYNTIYDRNYDRKFDSSKIEQYLGRKIKYTKIKEGLSLCLREFLRSNRDFLHIDPVYEAYQDLLCGETSSLEYFSSEYDYTIYKDVMIKGLDTIENMDNQKFRVI